MQFVNNAPVFTASGEQVGHVDRVVIDPTTKEVTHIVVRKGFIFTEDKVLPVSLISSGGEEVKLREDAGDLQRFPKFEERHYTLLDAKELGRIGLGIPTTVAPMYPYPPYGGTHPITYPIPKVVKETERNIPDETVALKEGAAVISADGDHVGDVEKVLTDPQADRITHFVISEGLLLKDRKLIPAPWVTLFQENKVHLSVGSDLLDRLPEYRI